MNISSTSPRGFAHLHRVPLFLIPFTPEIDFFSRRQLKSRVRPRAKSRYVPFSLRRRGPMYQCAIVQVENAQLKSEYVAATDKIQKLQNEIHRIEAEKRDNLNKIQNMHTEMKDLRRTLEEFESNKASEIRNLEASLTKSLSANKAVNDKFGHEQRMVGAMEQSNAELKEQIEKLEIDNRKQQESVKGYLEVIKNKKKVEEELLDTIREIKEKVEKYEEEKKNIAKAERLRKSSVATQEKAEKKEWEERMEKLKLQFDKAAVESKKNINKLQEENTKANGMIEEIRTDLEKKQVNNR